MVTLASGVHALAMGPAAGSCVVGGAGCRHTCSGEGQCRSKGQDQLWADWQLQGLLLLVCTTLLAGSLHSWVCVGA